MKQLATIVTIFLCSLNLAQAEPTITVYKSPTCGCCNKWIEHLQNNGFKVKAQNVKNLVSYKIDNSVSPQLSSCHTAIVDGYVIEGHVPANDIKRLLKTRAKVKGLAVPGMPIGSPGMEQGNRKDAYHVISFDEKGNTRVFSSYP